MGLGPRVRLRFRLTVLDSDAVQRGSCLRCSSQTADAPSRFQSIHVDLWWWVRLWRLISALAIAVLRMTALSITIDLLALLQAT